MNWKKTQVGNVQQFSQDVLKALVYTFMLGYFGGSMTAMCKLPPATLAHIYPSNPTQVPYHPSSFSDPNLGVFNSFWPTDSVGWPYKWMDVPVSDQLSVDVVFAWLARTCMHTFIAVRSTWLSFLQTFCVPNVNTWWGDAGIFYLLPHVTVAVASLPFMFILGWILTCYCSFKDHGIVHTCGVVMYPLSVLSNAPAFGVGALVSAWVYFVLACCMIPVFLTWWTGVAGMVWLYLWLNVYCTPFMFANGNRKMLNEVKAHSFSLTLIFMVLVVLASAKSLIPGVAGGISLMSLYFLWA